MSLRLIHLKFRPFLLFAATLWLAGQLVGVFHLDHEHPQGAAAAEHSCVLCNLAVGDDAIETTPLLIALAVVFVLSSWVLVQLPTTNRQLRFFARGPPAI